MAYVPSALAPSDLIQHEAKVAEARPGFFRRLLAAMQAARMRQAEREIAQYLAHAGGKFTDESEREIERRYLSGRIGW